MYQSTIYKCANDSDDQTITHNVVSKCKDNLRTIHTTAMKLVAPLNQWTRTDDYMYVRKDDCFFTAWMTGA